MELIKFESRKVDAVSSSHSASLPGIVCHGQLSRWLRNRLLAVTPLVCGVGNPYNS